MACLLHRCRARVRGMHERVRIAAQHRERSRAVWKVFLQVWHGAVAASDLLLFWSAQCHALAFLCHFGPSLPTRYWSNEAPWLSHYWYTLHEWLPLLEQLAKCMPR